ncbi:MAG: hypothetical protein ABEK50_00150, partial [bacterium]
GFILMESLVSLAMVSILAVGMLNFLQSISTSFRADQGDELASISLQATVKPESIGNRADVQLESIHPLNDDSTWRIFSYRTEDGSLIKVPVFTPARDQ